LQDLARGPASCWYWAADWQQRPTAGNDRAHPYSCSDLNSILCKKGSLRWMSVIDPGEASATVCAQFTPLHSRPQARPRSTQRICWSVAHPQAHDANSCESSCCIVCAGGQEAVGARTRDGDKDQRLDMEVCTTLGMIDATRTLLTCGERGHRLQPQPRYLA
jgi:hypothetical protein